MAEPDNDAVLPLAGIRVLDISNFLAAPMLTMFLADFGAEVIKVERPDTGDEMRFWGPDKDGVGLYFKVINRNKRVITADLRTELGADIVKKLAAQSDIVVENYRPGKLASWGLDYDVLSKDNPGLIMAKITGFGQTGPYKDRPGFGTLAESFGGYVNITGEADGPPLLPAFGLGDSTTGLAGAFLTMVALQARNVNGGRGQVIDLALYEPLFTFIGPHVIDYDQLGVVQKRAGSRLPFTAPRNTYRTRDNEYLIIGGSAQSTFLRICTALECMEIYEDPRFQDNRTRLQHVDALDEALQAAVEKFDIDDILARCAKVDATVMPVYDVEKAINDPHYQARETVVRLADEELGSVRMQNVVGKLSLNPGRITHAGPPLGKHNREVLVDELGYDPQVLLDNGLKLD